MSANRNAFASLPRRIEIATTALTNNRAAAIAVAPTKRIDFRTFIEKRRCRLRLKGIDFVPLA
jgi:hypothetical protein